MCVRAGTGAPALKGHGSHGTTVYSCYNLITVVFCAVNLANLVHSILHSHVQVGTDPSNSASSSWSGSGLGSGRQTEPCGTFEASAECLLPSCLHLNAKHTNLTSGQ